MWSSDADSAIPFGKESLLIDSNILLLLFVGLYDRKRIEKFKRTSQFTLEDFELLLTFIRRFKAVATTPSILTEVSNLLGQFPEGLKNSFYRSFAYGLKSFHECYTPSRELGNENAFPKLGLTDTAIFRAATGKFLVLTDDFRLAQYLSSQNVDVVNFNHLRTFD